MNRTRFIAQAGIIAAVYAALTVLTSQVLQVFSWGLVQFRVSEAFTVVALFTPAAVPGLALGSVMANLVALAQTGPLGWLDVVFGSFGSLLGAVWTWRFRRNLPLALAGPIFANALIVPAYLPVILAAVAPQLYEVPLFGWDFGGSWLAMYAFGVVSVGVGQAIVVYGLGLPLALGLRRLGLAGVLGDR